MIISNDETKHRPLKKINMETINVNKLKEMMNLDDII